MKKFIFVLFLMLSFTACAHNTENDSQQVGDIIQFGGYDWRVLAIEDGKALIISDKIIENMNYNETRGAVTWEQCSLRRYLNDDFYNSFNSTDKARIAETTVINSNNPWFNVHGGNDTTDKIFLLSIDELIRYFGDSGMLARGIDENARDGVIESEFLGYDDHGIFSWGIHDQYSEARIAYNLDGSGWWWWLRSPGNLVIGSAAVVYYIGNVFIDGIGVYGESRGGGVRPALWLNL